ncbi:HD domain-containing protein [Undibacterium sp.]|uniref:HD domain-containing protein n=1 Tax=Undibacterium sp. TaxID=1914977 RepID=UPI0027318E45|nr:ATP-binding protein [Undibacterium sp.]MDP1976153.1 ATP-binding protein [Undibacterium sp.]
MINDDWRAETQTRLTKSYLYNTLKSKCGQEPSGNHVLQLVDDATYYAFQRTKTILIHMGEFTLHDGDHLFRVLSLMERILPQDLTEKLSSPELMLLILSAFFHDIGMAPEVKTVLSWKKIWDRNPVFDDETDESEYRNFLRFYSSRPDQQTQIETFVSQENFSGVEMVKSYLVTDYIRLTHAQRAKEIIKAHWIDKIVFRDVDLAVEFATICFSHNDDALSLLELDKNYLCGPDVFACLPLVGVVLRLADLLDFDGKRTPSVLFSHLFVRHPISIKEWNKHRAVEAWIINSKTIQYAAKCKHPAIQASIHAFCDTIDNELSVCNNVISALNDFNKSIGREIFLQIPFKVDRSKIETQKDVFGNPEYLYRETQFNLSKSQVIDLLMGTKLYGDPAVALRELLQNSIDACLLRSALETSWSNSYDPQITVRYFQENGTDILEVTDNGIGMDQYIIDTYYSKVGSSFYKSSDFYDLKSESKAQFTPMSRFGIGILSAFMVADTISVDSRKIYGPHTSSEPLQLTIEGQESIFWTRPGKRKIPGTSTKLFLRKNKNPWHRMADLEFVKSVENVIPNPPFKIKIESGSENKQLDENTFEAIKVSSLKNYYWKDHENIKEFTVDFSDKAKGLVGSAIIAILEHSQNPVNEINVNAKSVKIDGATYKLDKSISVEQNIINIKATSIEIDDNGKIEQSTSSNVLVKSSSKVSLHGIEVSTTLFPDSWNRQKNQVKLDWPLPMLIVLDVCGNRDLDLNSARTQIIMSDKWIQLEEELCFVIFSQIASQVTLRYWNQLKKLLLLNTKNDLFISGLHRVVKTSKRPRQSTK